MNVVGSGIPGDGVKNVAQLEDIAPDARVIEFLHVVVGKSRGLPIRAGKI